MYSRQVSINVLMVPNYHSVWRAPLVHLSLWRFIFSPWCVYRDQFCNLSICLILVQKGQNVLSVFDKISLPCPQSTHFSFMSPVGSCTPWMQMTITVLNLPNSPYHTVQISRFITEEFYLFASQDCVWSFDVIWNVAHDTQGLSCSLWFPIADLMAIACCQSPGSELVF